MTEEYDITGGLDLLGDWLDAKGYTEEAGLCTRAMDFIHKQGEENARLHQAMHDIYEVYAGSEGTAGMKHPELYLQGCVQEMAYIAGKHKRAGENDDYAR